MKYNSNLNIRVAALVILLAAASQSVTINAQQSIGFGVHANPLIGWFRSDNSSVPGKGANAGFNFGASVYKYFSDNYALSAGINLVNAGGSLSYSDTTILNLKNNKRIKAFPKSKLVYNVKYLALPVGLKLRTNEIGYISIFTDIGLDPKFIIGGKVEVPSQDIGKENARKELKTMGLGYHAIGGIEYSLGGTSSVVLGINFDNNFTNIMKKHSNRQSAKITHKMFGLYVGMNF